MVSGYLIIITGLLYIFTCIDLFIHNKIGLSLAYFGYALANVGLYFAAQMD